MRTTQGNTLRSLRTVQQFLSEHAERLPRVVDSGARRQLDETITSLSAHVTNQSGTRLVATGLTRTQYALRRVLVRDHLNQIASIARAERAAVPAIAPFRVPRGKPTVEQLVAAAHGMATAAAPYSTLFTSAGMPADFIARLTSAADALRASLDDRAERHGERSGATKGIKSLLTTGRKLVHVLNTFVQRDLQDDAPLLAHWNTIRRVQRVTRSSSEATAPATSTHVVSLTASDSASMAAPKPALAPQTRALRWLRMA